MSWQSCRLGDVITLKRGHDLPESSRLKGNVPVVSSAGITGYHKEAKANAPGVVTGRYGTLGEVYFLEEDYWPLNTALYVIDFHGNDPQFIAYFLKNALKNYQSDKAAVPGIDRNVLHEMSVAVPSHNAQLQIRRVLAAYDDLIENNRRRIRLLEESARLLYREWFVHLRFPGHEHVKVMAGVPQGWERIPLGDVLTLQRGFDLPVSERVEGSIPIYASTGINGFHNQAMANAPGVVTGRSGSLGTVMYVLEDYWPLNTALWVKEFKRVPPVFAYHLLGGMQLAQYNGGAAVPTLNRNDVHRVEVLCPSESLLAEFSISVEPTYRQMKLLEEQNKKLAQVRDILLPRLMSGETTV